MRSKSKNIFSLVILLSILIIPQIFFPTRNEVKNSIDNENKLNNDKTDSFENNCPKKSNTMYIDNKYNLSDWWNATFKYRMCIELEENHSIVRYQPIHVYLTFQENEHIIDSTRLVSYNATGKNEWSQLIPIQVWNITKYYLTNYIQSCTIIFIANISANSNQIYFLYYNDNMDGIDIPCYNTNFSSVLSNGKLSASVGRSESKFEVLIEENYGMSKLEKGGINYHTIDSLAPEKQLTHPSVELLLHCDEEGRTTVYDSSFNEFEGSFVGNTKWSSGKLYNGIEFDGNGDYITFDDILNKPLGSTSKNFTITMWIKPKTLTSSISNHGVMNCFLAKASTPYDDNIELGINKINNTHGLLNVFIGTALKHNTSIYGNKDLNPILINNWNFISVRYSEGDVDVQINNVVYVKDIYNKEPWSGAKYLDQASGSYFTLGATIDSNVFYNGSIDEVVVYNSSLGNGEINQFKLTKSKSSIESVTELENGKVFSRYKIVWKQIFDMHIEDIITFYNDYNLWNIYRCIYFDNKFNPDKASMNALNTYYNFSKIYNQKEGKYFYDGIVSKDLTSSGFVAENYSVIYTPNPFNVSVGIFVEEYELADNLQSSITELKGNVTYCNNITEFTPGSITDFDNNNGGSDFKLYVDFWEFMDTLNQSGTLNDNDLLKYINDTLSTLRNPINIYVYYQETLIFELIVQVKDIDNNPVNQATVSIYNLTVDGDIDQLILNQKTNLDGKITFTDLKNGTYTVNVTYEKYGHPAFQIIKQPINITIDNTKADKYGRVFHSFYNVSLTSVEMQVQRIDPDTHQIKELVVNANVSFWVNNGSGNEYIGYELTDILGMVKFQWKNFSSAEEGNVTFTINWYDTILNISCEDDDVVKANPTNITLAFYKENIITVNLSSYRFSTALVESIPETAYLGDEITFQVNYSYTINYTNPLSIEGASVYYYIQHENVNISSRLIQFNETAIKGTYLTKINTSKPEDPSLNLLGDNTYIMVVYASKQSYIPRTTTILFELAFKESNLTAKNDELEVYWGENITLEVYYESLHQIPYTGINGASVTFSVIDFPNINGSLISNGTIGWYKLKLNSSIFINYLTNYSLKIKAIKYSFEECEITINLKINLRIINIKLPDSFRNDEISIYSGESLNLGIELVDFINNRSIIDARVYLFFKNNNYSFIDNDNGIYTIIINNVQLSNTNLEYEDFLSRITINKSMYLTQIIDFDIEVNKKEFDVTLDANNLDHYEIKVVNGKDINIEIILKDPTKNFNLVKGASIVMDIVDEIYTFSETSDGIYDYEFSTKEYEGFTERYVLNCIIYINKENFKEEKIELIIVIELEEIYPGIPMFYLISIIEAFYAIISIIVGYIIIRSDKFLKLKKYLKKVTHIEKRKKNFKKNQKRSKN